jgi:hypothetical protein
MGIRDKLRRLERHAEGELISIPQRDGSIARFPKSDLEAAFLVNVDRVCGRDVEPHPLSLAIQNAAYREQWHESFFDMVEVSEVIEDLSE